MQIAVDGLESSVIISPAMLLSSILEASREEYYASNHAGYMMIIGRVRHSEADTPFDDTHSSHQQQTHMLQNPLPRDGVEWENKGERGCGIVEFGEVGGERVVEDVKHLAAAVVEGLRKWRYMLADEIEVENENCHSSLRISKLGALNARRSHLLQTQRDEWSEGAVSSLLEAYESKWILRNRAKLKGHDWEDVARFVSSRANCTKSPKTQTQCKNKIESMKKRYRSESATADASSWPLYPRLDLLLRGSAAAEDGVATKLSDHVSDKNAMDTDSSTPALYSDKEKLRWLAEVVVRSEQARMDTMREVEKMRIEAEAKRAEMDLKRTEIIANTQLEIAKLFAGVDYSHVKKMEHSSLCVLMSCKFLCPLYTSWPNLLAVEYEKNAMIVKVDTDDEYEFAHDMQVRGLPTLFFISPDPKKDAIRAEGLIPIQMMRDIIDKEM
ncbi:hypothetical protein GH714_017641 [Hevea brasiliensis]|uniref:Uncharacterized protein n=1 Tax=Hevea brasiliensis TaxID=3981 RepID=A0A6A6LMH7_HEVBR|nr:hypothetical protein GH714_017641 [Hevea brasiliensis]